MKKNDYLERILKARVYDVAIESPLELAPALSRRLGNRVLLKREDLQPVFSFKLRGAYNKMAHLPPASAAARRDLPPRPATTRRAWRSPRSGSAARRRSSCRSPRRTSRSTAVAARGARGRAARRLATTRPTRTRARCSSDAALTFVHPYDDPGRDRRAGHDRHGDPAPARRADRRDLRRRSAAAG